MAYSSSVPDAVTDENRTEALSVLQDFATQIPRATAPRRIALTIATGEASRPLYWPPKLYLNGHLR